MTSSTVQFLLFSLLWIGAVFPKDANAASTPLPTATAYFSNSQNTIAGASPWDNDISGGQNDIVDLRSLSIPCRNDQDVLAQASISVYAGDISCMKSASICAGFTIANCTRDQIMRAQADRSGTGSIVSDCLRQAQSNISTPEFSRCIALDVVRNCDISGCSSCPSSINATFDKKCTSGGDGQLCRQTPIVARHRIGSLSFCFPSRCSSKVLATSLAKVYAAGMRQAGGPNTETLINEPDFADSEISCGSGDQSYTVRSSAPDKPVSGCRSLEAASRLAAVAAVFSMAAILRLF